MTEYKTKIIAYYPRSRFWKIWEKRQIMVILTETKEKVTSQNFYKSGILQREYLRWKDGDSAERFYFPDGKLMEQITVCGDEERQIQWDEKGNVALDKRDLFYWLDSLCNFRAKNLALLLFFDKIK